MRSIILSLILTTIIMTQTQAQNLNINSVENTINLYFDGMINHNSESIKKAFIPSASMKWIEKGEYMEVNATEALTQYLDANKPTKSIARITSMNIQGDVANVGLEIEYETFTFVDQMHLLKIKDQWLIVSKSYTTIPKEF